MPATPDSPLAASLRAILAKQDVPGARDTPPVVLASLRKILAEHGNAAVAMHDGPAAAPSAKPSAPEPTRASLLAKLEAATDNNTRWELAKAINDAF